MDSSMHLVGGFDTIVVGNGSDSITALAGISTIVAGNGNDQILIGGSYNTIVAGNGADHVVGLNVDHTTIVLGNGGCTVNLTGQGCNVVQTGSGNDVISLSGTDNWVDAGAASTFNTIFGGAGKDTFVLALSGTDKIFNFDLRNGDHSICKMYCRARTGMVELATSATSSRPRSWAATRCWNVLPALVARKRWPS